MSRYLWVKASGPTPVHLLAAAVGNCLSDALYFALAKFKQSPEPIHTVVNAEVGRNAEGRMRVLRIEAKLHLGVEADQLEHLDRVLSQFEGRYFERPLTFQSIGAK